MIIRTKFCESMKVTVKVKIKIKILSNLKVEVKPKENQKQKYQSKKVKIKLNICNHSTWTRLLIFLFSLLFFWSTTSESVFFHQFPFSFQNALKESVPFLFFPFVRRYKPFVWKINVISLLEIHFSYFGIWRNETKKKEETIEMPWRCYIMGNEKRG